MARGNQGCGCMDPVWPGAFRNVLHGSPNKKGEWHSGSALASQAHHEFRCMRSWVQTPLRPHFLSPGSYPVFHFFSDTPRSVENYQHDGDSYCDTQRCPANTWTSVSYRLSTLYVSAPKVIPGLHLPHPQLGTPRIFSQSGHEAPWLHSSDKGPGGRSPVRPR